MPWRASARSSEELHVAERQVRAVSVLPRGADPSGDGCDYLSGECRIPFLAPCRARRRPPRDNGDMASVQTVGEIRSVVEHVHGARVVVLQVLGINSLKSLAPPLDALLGDTIEGSEVLERILTVRTSRHTITFDLQRAGKVVWRGSEQAYRMGSGPLPTVRLVTDKGAVDLTEPSKTKRITVVVNERGE